MDQRVECDDPGGDTGDEGHRHKYRGQEKHQSSSPMGFARGEPFPENNSSAGQTDPAMSGASDAAKVLAM
jgi:hypothetical protein